MAPFHLRPRLDPIRFSMHYFVFHAGLILAPSSSRSGSCASIFSQLGASDVVLRRYLLLEHYGGQIQRPLCYELAISLFFFVHVATLFGAALGLQARVTPLLFDELGLQQLLILLIRLLLLEQLVKLVRLSHLFGNGHRGILTHDLFRYIVVIAHISVQILVVDLFFLSGDFLLLDLLFFYEL